VTVVTQPSETPAATTLPAPRKTAARTVVEWIETDQALVKVVKDAETGEVLFQKAYPK
jgi:hypothetical protein